MIRRCLSCQAEIPHTEAAWKKLCVPCFIRKKGGMATLHSKKYVPAPPPNLSSELRTAVEAVTPRRPAPFGSISELMEFLFSSEARAASAKQCVMRLEKSLYEMQKKLYLLEVTLQQTGLTLKKVDDLMELCSPEIHNHSRKSLGATDWLKNAKQSILHYSNRPNTEAGSDG